MGDEIGRLSESRIGALPSPVPRVAEGEFHEILWLVLAWLSKLAPVVQEGVQP